MVLARPKLYDRGQAEAMVLMPRTQPRPKFWPRDHNGLEYLRPLAKRHLVRSERNLLLACIINVQIVGARFCITATEYQQILSIRAQSMGSTWRWTTSVHMHWV